MAKNIFIIGLNDFNRELLKSLPDYDQYRFHQLLDRSRFVNASEFPVAEMLRDAEQSLASFDGPVDGIIGYMDFPVSTMLPVLCGKFGLRCASLESVLKCEHKYWSRLEQSRVVPEHIPRFRLFDPFDERALESIDLEFPFWIKPVKSCGAYLGFRIPDRKTFEQSVAVIRENIGRLAQPFGDLLEHADLPPEIASVDPHACLAESLIGGRQCTLEGYVFEGQPVVYGVVDSIRQRNRSTFSRYQYPSALPNRVQRPMAEIAKRVIAHIGYDNAAFNMEFFWDERHDHLWLLEINTRIAQSHCDLFEKVDGTSSHQVAVQLSVGAKPALPSRQGNFQRAAHFFIRHYQDAVVTAVPDQDQIRALQEAIPGTWIEVLVRPGDRLSELYDLQDSYSYEIVHLYIGAQNQRQLLERYQQCADALDFQYADPPATAPPAPHLDVSDQTRGATQPQQVAQRP